jgi:very-short-patch-repair endonuclease
MLPYNHRLKTKARTLRTNPTDAELHLWHRLRRKQILGVQFYRQKPIGRYIADFYAPAARLVVELDGAQHLKIGQAQYDAQRSKYLHQIGLKVLRFDDREVLLQTDCVLEAIFQATEKSLLTSLCQREEPSIEMSSAHNSALAPEYSITQSKAR